MIVIGESRTNINNIDKLRELAFLQSSDAIFDLSVHYLNGDIVEKDYKYAINLLSDLANQRDVVAQRVLGNIYLDGEHLGVDDQGEIVNNNIDLGISLLRQAADNGDEVAQSQLILLSKKNELLDDDVLVEYKKNIVKNVLSHKHKSSIIMGLSVFFAIVLFGIFGVYELISTLMK